MTLQKTIAQGVSISGIGLHTGVEVEVTLKPATENSGITFIRTDLNGAEIKPLPHMVQHSPLCTLVANEQGQTISTIEHLMATLCGLGINNLVVQLNGPELPILDGSALPWLELIDSVGLQEQNAEVIPIVITEELQISDGDKLAKAVPADDFILELDMDFSHDALPKSSEKFVISEEFFRSAVASARTFCLKRDVDAMLAAGLIKGGSLDCAVVFDENGPVEGQSLRQTSISGGEPFAHKLLDAMGDLYLLARPIQGHITLKYPGHKINNLLLRELLK